MACSFVKLAKVVVSCQTRLPEASAGANRVMLVCQERGLNNAPTLG